VPEDEFESPCEVVESEAISEREKKKILDQWEVDEEALARAGDEGMVADAPTRLPAVQRAQRKMSRK
jgi:DNA-directed RNA polymerase subunit H (RpoH/RPB5)